MPVRKIPKNHLMVTGGYSSSKNTEIDAFESLLEKDYLLLLDFDESVRSFEVQPVHIPVPGVPRGYVPDVLVRYHPDPSSGLEPKPSLVEVKDTSDLVRNADKYAKKFECATRFAQEHGWEFKIVDQNKIRTPRLANLKFLREYRNIKPSDQEVDRVRQHVGTTSRSHHEVLDQLAQTDDDRLYWLPIIWSMLLTGHLVTDLNEPFSGDVHLVQGGIGSWPK